MIQPPPQQPAAPRRAPVIVVILLMLVLAGVANATIKRHRVAASAAPSSAVSVVHTSGSASSSAWYCAGPLPLGLKKEHSSLVLANVSSQVTHGELVVATVDGVISSEPITVGGDSSTTLALPKLKRPAFASATVLAGGDGLAVREAIDGTAGRDASACVSHATTEQYLAGGATTRPSTVVLSLFDPSATPAVASVAFATPNGVVSPPAYQGLPITAGTTLVLNVSEYLPSQSIIGTTVTSSGGPLVVGALDSQRVGHPVLPSLVTAAAVPERQWWFAPAPAGTSTQQRFSILNPGTSAAHVELRTDGPSGSAVENVTLPAGGIASLTPAPESQLGALRWATLTASEPVVVTRAETLLGSTDAAHSASSKALSPAAKLVSSLPSGYSVAGGIPVLSHGWLIGDGGSDPHSGLVVLVANPSSTAAIVSFTSLSGSSNPPPVTVAAGSSDVVAVPGRGGGVMVVNASAAVIVASGTYATGSVGWSSPAATVVD